MKLSNKLYKHGGSLGLILPAEFTSLLSSPNVDIELVLDAESNPKLIVEESLMPSTLEDDPRFPQFMESLYSDVFENPRKLKKLSDVITDDIRKLVEGVDTEDE